MISITRKFYWCMGHRLMDHDGGCQHLHGHNYEAEVEIRAVQLNDMGMVMDFKLLDTMVGTWIHVNWDHHFMLCDRDPISPALKSIASEIESGHGFALSDRIVEVSFNPTAENIAFRLAGQVRDSLREVSDEFALVRVTVRETPKSSATFTP